MADIYINVGEWMVSLKQRMKNATNEDIIYLPTKMHLHAFELLQEAEFGDKQFKINLLAGDQ
jgi:hypothetical protein